VDTGLNTNIGQRLLRVRRHLAGEKTFLANYSDGLSNVRLDRQIADFERRGVTASFVAVRPVQSFHGVQSDEDGIVTAFGAIGDAGFSINTGFFCLRSDIFEYMKEGDELVEQPFQRLIARRQLGVFRHEGFWQPMDTFKDKMAFDSMDARGECPWMLWKHERSAEQTSARLTAVHTAAAPRSLHDAKA
jgi:glucose-1-phosphate cytidylyltransferase